MLTRLTIAETGKQRRGMILMAVNCLLQLAMFYFCDPDQTPLIVPLGIDLGLTILLLTLATPQNEFVAILVFLMGYYSFVLGGTHVLGLHDYSDNSVTSTLQQFGLRVPEDIVRYTIIYAIFKSALLLLALRLLPADSQAPWSEAERFGISASGLAVWLMVAIGGRLLLQRGLFDVGVQLLASMLAIRLCYFPGSDRYPWARFGALLAILPISFLLTRSRGFVAALMLYYLADIWQSNVSNDSAEGAIRGAAGRLKVAVLIAFSFVVVALYGAWRGSEGGLVSMSDALLENSHLEADGEAGLMFLFGAHVASYREAQSVPTDLEDSLVDKFWRIIPWVPWKTQMLADRYTRLITPSASDEAGWAFPSVAEVYLYYGMAGVLAFAAAVALTFSLLAQGFSRLSWRCLAIMVTFSFQRMELSQIGIMLLFSAIWIYLIQRTTEIWKASRKTAPSAHIPGPHLSGSNFQHKSWLAGSPGPARYLK